MGQKSECCLKYAAKAKACSGCPLMAGFSKKKRKKKLEKLKKRMKKAP